MPSEVVCGFSLVTPEINFLKFQDNSGGILVESSAVAKIQQRNVIVHVESLKLLDPSNPFAEPGRCLLVTSHSHRGFSPVVELSTLISPAVLTVFFEPQAWAHLKPLKRFQI